LFFESRFFSVFNSVERKTINKTAMSRSWVFSFSEFFGRAVSENFGFFLSIFSFWFYKQIVSSYGQKSMVLEYFCMQFNRGPKICFYVVQKCVLMNRNLFLIFEIIVKNLF